MTPDPIPLETTYTITDLVTLKVLSDPLRLRIYQAVSERNRSGSLCSAKILSDLLHIPQTKLYYHLKLLEAHALLLVVETRIVSGIVEKYYRARAHRLEVDNALFAQRGGKEALLPMLSGAFDDALRDLQSTLKREAISPEAFHIAFARRLLRLTPEQMEKYAQRLEETLKEIEAETAQGSAGGDLYTLFYVLYPAPPQEEE